MKQTLNVFLLISLVVSLRAADETDSAKCTHTVEKSAVTEEAAKEAAKALKKPPIFSNEVYSSKVKSRFYC